jgi:hypothetical protein
MHAHVNIPYLYFTNHRSLYIISNREAKSMMLQFYTQLLRQANCAVAQNTSIRMAYMPLHCYTHYNS